MFADLPNPTVPASPLAHARRLAIGAIHVLIVVTLLLIPVWYRLPASPFGSPLYVTRFAILIPAVGAIALWLLAGLPGLRALRRSRWGVSWAALLLGLALWMWCSAAWAYIGRLAPDVAVNAALTYSIAALFAVVVACVGSARMTVRTLAIGVLANAALTVAQSLNGGDLGLQIFGEFPHSAELSGVSVIVSGAWRYIRPYGLLPHPNILAGTLLVGLLAGAALFIGERRAWRWIGAGAVLLASTALVMTFSRAAWLGGATAAIAVFLAAFPLWRERAVRARAFALAGALVILGIGLFIAYRPLIAARAGIGEESVELRSVADRLVYTDFALRSIAQRPVFGVGAGNFPYRSAVYLRSTFYDLRGDNVHHVYLLAIAELGAVGGVLLVGALACGGLGAIAGVRASGGAERAARAGLLAAVAAIAVIGWFDHYPHTILHVQIAWWSVIAAGQTVTPYLQAEAAVQRHERWRRPLRPG